MLKIFFNNEEEAEISEIMKIYSTTESGSYPEEFKQRVIQFSEQHKNVADWIAAIIFGVSKQTLQTWMRPPSHVSSCVSV